MTINFRRDSNEVTNAAHDSLWCCAEEAARLQEAIAEAERKLKIETRVKEAAIRSNAHWDDACDYLVWERADVQAHLIPDEHIASTIALYPQFQKDIEDFAARWNADEPITEEMLVAIEAEEETAAQVEKTSRRAMSIINFYIKLRKIEAERDTALRELEEARGKFLSARNKFHSWYLYGYHEKQGEGSCVTYRSAELKDVIKYMDAALSPNGGE